MAVLAFVLFWVLVAIGLVYLGLRSNRKPDSVNTSRGGRAHWYLGFAAIVATFGILLPIASTFGRQDDSRTVPTADIGELTEDQENGRALFGKYCKICHALEAANAVAQVGPNLDELRPNVAILEDAIENGRARGNGAMAQDLVSGKDREDVIDFVTAAVGSAEEDDQSD